MCNEALPLPNFKSGSIPGISSFSRHFKVSKKSCWHENKTAMWKSYPFFSASTHFNLPETFTFTSDQLHLSGKDKEGYEKQEFFLDCLRNIQKPGSNIPTWAGCKSFLSKQQVSTVQVGFIPFIPSSVTDQSTV